MVCNVTQIRVSEAAQFLGVSDDTVRRLLASGSLESGGGSPATVDGASLGRYARQNASAPVDGLGVARSARNRFVGVVTEVISDTVMSQVELQCGPHRVVSLMSTESVRELGLEEGVVAVAVVKATTVIVETAQEER